MDVGMNTEFKVKLTPKDDKAVYSQSVLMSMHLKEDLTVESALMLKHGIITALPFSKYASPIFAQRKPNGKLRPLVDLKIIKSLIADVYNKNNLPVSTFLDAAQHLALKSLFCQLDCSHAYHCLQMAEQRPMEMLPFNFAGQILPTKDLHEVSADQCLPFQESWVSTCTQLSKLTNVLSTWKTLESQPMRPRTLPRTLRHSSSAFAQQDWIWQSRNAISESEKLNSWGQRFHQMLTTSSENPHFFRQT